jgi:hypothetical protein
MIGIGFRTAARQTLAFRTACVTAVVVLTAPASGPTVHAQDCVACQAITQRGAAGRYLRGLRRSRRIYARPKVGD